MGGDFDDPARINVLAVSADDVVAALEARRQRARPVVLRATPPFSGRMRARLHAADGEANESSAAFHVDPDAFVDDAPQYPRPADTEDALRADPEREYTVERHHDRHRDALESWREAIGDHFVESTTVDLPSGIVTVDVVVLG